MNKNDYVYSRPLDVHRWSEHTEVNKFVDDIYNTYFKQKTSIRKKHLKVILAFRNEHDYKKMNYVFRDERLEEILNDVKKNIT